jgi:glycosyltransferase involved in cell wall biosynthesis
MKPVMKVLVLTWEFPPRIVGGIARHVGELYPALAEQQCEIHLLTVQFGDAPLHEWVEGIQVHRVPVGESQDFFDWVRRMNQVMRAYAEHLLIDQENFDLIHAHDWLVGDCAIALKHRFKLPLVATIHATEHGRNQGIHNSIHRYVHEKEHLLVHEAWRVIVCTQFMLREVAQTFNAPADKIDVIYNGIRAEKKQLAADFDRVAFRQRFAQDDEKIVYYVGRITYEKGIARLIEAIPQVIKQLRGKVKLVIVGGGNTASLQLLATDLGLGDRCLFTGFMPDEELDQFQAIADCAVFPSLYEPFGIVALESFAARVPVVVSDAGGLAEIVRHGKTGIVTHRGDAVSIAAGILQVLAQPELAQQMVENAYQELHQRFNWHHLAQQTALVYDRVVQERRQTYW